jgi:predicted regulator of Ras-like GTPase activity (Roadblock/LC7/MglB family)
VPEVLKLTVDRIVRLEHVRAAAIAESSGLVLAGSGELADALAAFGAYIRDAASRSVRLLPLRAADEVTVRDGQGLVFSARVVGRADAGLSLVMLASGDVSAREIREIVAQTPGLDAGASSAR